MSCPMRANTVAAGPEVEGSWAVAWTTSPASLAIPLLSFASISSILVNGA